MADTRIGQKAEIVIVLPPDLRVTRTTEQEIALLPDCARHHRSPQ
jgi:hypothetical protein